MRAKSTAVLGAVLAATIVIATVRCGPHGGAAGGPVEEYYLALGDSVAYGYQASRDRGSTVDAAAFDHGYVDVIDHVLNLGESRVTTVNMSCPGESTITMVAGGCPWTLAGDPLHFPVDGPQLDAAVRFLTAHRDHVPLVSLTVWGNDVVLFEQRCNFELACIAALAPTEIVAISTRLASIVAAIHLAAPRAMIVVTGPWDTEIDDLAAVDPLIAALDRAMQRATVGAGGVYASMFPVFNPQGNLDREQRVICALTSVCDGDSHPTDLGYQVIAARVLAQLVRR